jgi:hypothetical protein
MTTERLRERGRALLAWEAAGGSVDRLAVLDRRTRRGLRTDWPGRGPGEEVRNGIPDLDLPDPEADDWRIRVRCARCGRDLRREGHAPGCRNAPESEGVDGG